MIVHSYIRIAISLLCLTFFTACEKDGSKRPASTPISSNSSGLAGAVKSITDTEDGQSYFIHEYDYAAGKVSESRVKGYAASTIDTGHVHTFIYNWSTTNLVEIDWYEMPDSTKVTNDSVQYSFNSGRLHQQIIKIPNIRNSLDFVYNSSGDLIEIVDSKSIDSASGVFSINVDMDANGNLRKLTISEPNGDDVGVEFTYDNKPNPFKGMVGLHQLPGLWFQRLGEELHASFFSKNNVTSYTATRNGVPEGAPLNYSYQYDSSGKPIYREITSSGFKMWIEYW